MTAISHVLDGFRLFTGSKINEIIDAVNNLTGGGTAGPVTGTTGTFSGAVTGSGFAGTLDGVLGGTTPAAGTVTDLTTTGNIVQTLAAKTAKVAYQTVTAAGATQGDATAITGSKAIITIALTASTKGVRLPTAVTGLEVVIANAATFGCKVYPAVNGKLGASATNAAIVLAINKCNKYLAVNSTRWILQVGG
jgi:hypothetical protein